MRKQYKVVVGLTLSAMFFSTGSLVYGYKKIYSNFANRETRQEKTEAKPLQALPPIAQNTQQKKEEHTEKTGLQEEKQPVFRQGKEEKQPVQIAKIPELTPEVKRELEKIARKEKKTYQKAKQVAKPETKEVKQEAKKEKEQDMKQEQQEQIDAKELSTVCLEGNRVCKLYKNSKEYNIGDSIGNYRIKAITLDSVILEKNGEVKRIEIK